MTTYRDVYEIETATAVENVDKLAEAMKGTGEQAKKAKGLSEEMADFLSKDLKDSIFSATAAYDLLKQSVQAVGHFVMESVGAFLEAEQANMRLGMALKNVGADSVRWVAQLDAQASSIERLTGLDGEYIKGLQAMLTTMGVAPEMLERFTLAAVNLSIATGQDAKTAALALARANSEGREDLKKYGIQIDETAFQARGFAATLEAVEGKFGNLIDAQPDLLKQTNELKGAWRDFGEAVGEAALKFVSFGENGRGAVKVLDAISEALKRAHFERARFQQIASIAFPAIAPLAGLATLSELMGGDAAKGASAAPAAAPTGQVDVTVGDATMSDAEFKRIQEARKKALEAAKKYREDMNALSVNGASNLAKIEDEENRKMLKRIADQGDWEQAAFEENLKARQQQDKDALEILKQQEEERQRVLDKKLAKEKQHWDGMKQAAEGYFMGFIGSQVAFIRESLTINTEFNRQMFEAELERRTAGKEASDVEAERAKMEKEFAADRANTYLKMTADSLASIAEQAGVKAVYEGVEAIAALAVGDVAGAGLHGTAAAGFAALAVAAGGTAAAISSARGLSGDERKQLESATKSKEERKAREDKAASERSQAAGTIVNVYNLGITGQTSVEQGRELDRIRKQYEATKTGGM